jgi:hypothetical protein
MEIVVLIGAGIVLAVLSGLVGLALGRYSLRAEVARLLERERALLYRGQCQASP